MEDGTDVISEKEEMNTDGVLFEKSVPDDPEVCVRDSGGFWRIMML
jgi:hypothetical protein